MRKRTGTEVAEADIHLKLDRLVAGQDRILARLEEQEETIAVLIAGMVTLTETIATQTETINRLSEAMSQDADSGDVQSLIESIAVSLKQIKEDGARMVVLVGRLPNAVAQAAQDGVLIAMGGGADIPPDDQS
jgi:hypothetical protein